MSLLSRLAVQAARAYGILSSNPNNVPASYLVVAGGGGSVSGGGAGGGGAGGFRTGTSTLSTLTTYSITVGGGGAGGTGTFGNGTNGSDSVFSSVTSTGGGGSRNNPQGTGGSGSGAAGSSSVSAGGIGNTPSTSPSQGNNGGANAGIGSPVYAAGGGGGAGAVGSNGSGSVAGNGGAGTASSITGSSVTYAGGGGGGTESGGTAGTGGAGGGGNGSISGTGGAGTANTGGGAGGTGGTSGSTAGAAGGSGVVIISYTSATPRFVGGTLTTSGGNQIHTFTSSGTLSPLTPVTASYLVVAGGGGGGAERNGGGAGGGGAGGLLTSSTTIYSGATYVVTVGAGGAGAAAANPANSGTAGSNSVVSGTGLTTLTATGGGFGGAQSTSTVGGNGGSGGGGWSGGASPPYAGGTGTSGQGNNGGSGNTTGNTGGGGGGGASAVGGSWSGSNGSNNGGAGTASSITGSSVTYAGGGGGGVGGGAASTGGAGGGGAGGAGAPGPGGSGTTNLGAGGGGGAGNNANPGAGGSGGSGTVIISYAGSQVFNGGLVTSSGGNTIHTFLATGALTPLTNNLTNSLRFRASASAYLSRTPTLATNRRTWTLSMWIKRGSNFGSQSEFFTAGTSGSNYLTFQFDTSNRLALVSETPSLVCELRTTSVYRDPAAWYHITLAVDTTQATSANRLKLYVNGNQVTAFATATYPTQNTDLLVNSAVAHYFSHNTSGGGYFDGYDTDINFIDGQALEPYYFGNNDAYGNWKPILYKGMYGTNGFYLPFSDTSALTTSSNVGLGKDFSGNGNYWATNNISITAGVTYDAMTDVPTNTSATVANYATLSAIDYKITAPSNGGLTEVAGGGIFGYARATQALSSSNKTYAECTVLNNVSNSAQFDFGVATNDVDVSAIPTTNSWIMEFQTTAPRRAYSNGSQIFSIGGVLVAGDTCQIAFDMSTGNGWMGVNNVWYNSTGGTTGDPSTGVNPTFTGLSGLTLFPVVRVYGQQVDLNFGQRPFSYTAPSGYVALNTYNLPTPTILQGNKYMDATTFTATSGAQSIVNQGQFKPDLVWLKARSNAQSNYLVDSVRGGTSLLRSEATSAESTSTSPAFITSFNSNGFSTDTASLVTNAYTYVGWQWQAGQGTNTTNTAGSITSTVSVNTTAGFSVVNWTGSASASAQTVGHGLGVTPKMVILKNRSVADNWFVYHSSVTANNQYLNLNTTSAVTTAGSNTWGAGMTSTLVGLRPGTFCASSSDNVIMYCWAEIAGFSSFGSYTGNASTDGPFVYTGFRPKYVLIKASSGTTGNWILLDTSRDTYNMAVNVLEPDVSDAEAALSPMIDILSNGFKVRRNSAGVNGSGYTYIYIAFAENPFKNANAR